MPEPSRREAPKRRGLTLRQARAAWFGLLAVCVLGSVVRATPDLRFCTDDAWISFRYAWNLVHGAGLNWNPGMPPVEGYSNLLWVLWAALGIAVGAPVLTWCKASGMALTAGSVLAAAGCVRASGGSRALALAAAFLTACSSLVVLWGASGMETPLLCLLLTAGTWRALQEDRAIRDGGRLRAWSLLLFGLAAVTRVEGPIYLAIPVVIRLARLGVQPLGRRDALHLLLLCAPALGQFAFRLAYYGEWLSNTYVVKGGDGLLSERNLSGLRYLLGGLTANPWLGVLWFIGGALALWYRRGSLLLPVAMCAVFILYVGGDAFSHMRFLAPAVPTLTAAGLVGLDRARRHMGASRWRWPVLAGIVALVLGAAQLDFRIHRIRLLTEQPWSKHASGPSLTESLSPPYSEIQLDPLRRFNLPAVLHEPPRSDRVDWFLAYLMENVPAGESFVFMDVGLVGYTMYDASLLDGRGLNWAPMAHLINTKLPAGPGALEDPLAAAVLADFHEQRPAVLCLQNNGPRLFGPFEALLMADGALERDYEFVARGPYWGEEDRVAIYRRRGVARVSAQTVQQRYRRMADEAPLINDWERWLSLSQLPGHGIRPEAPYANARAPKLTPAGDYRPGAVRPPARKP